MRGGARWREKLSDRRRLVDAPARVRRRIATDERLLAFVRSGDKAAFEALYERFARELLSFCVYMLGSRQDAEDALQATFASAYSSLMRDSRPIQLRPWLFAIARNDCVSILRRRRPYEELNGEPALGPDPVRELELREELREIVSNVRSLPENERAALVLTEVHGLSQHETGDVLGVRADQVKAYVYQARSKLVSERAAREADCEEIREELAGARGAALLRGRLRRHMRSCPECRTYAAGLSRQRRQLAALLPLAPSLALRYRALEEALGLGAGDPGGYTAGGAAVGASVAGAAAEVAGGGIKALAFKIAAGVAAIGAGAGVGVSVLTTPPEPEASRSSSARSHTVATRLLADSGAPGQGGSAIAQRLGLDGAGAEVAGGVAPKMTLPEGSRVTGPTGAGLEGSPAAEPRPSTGASEPPSAVVVQPRPRRVRTPDPTPPKTEQQRQALESERRQSRETRLHTTEARKQEREAHGPPGSSRVEPSEAEREQKKAERKKLREERPPEGHSRAPKSAEELRLRREERLKRREERRAAEKEEAPAP